MSSSLAFWFAVTICVVTVAIVNLLKSRARLAVIRAAVEKSQPLDPLLMRTLMHAPVSEVRPGKIFVTGITLMAVGVGCLPYALFSAHEDIDALYSFGATGCSLLAAGIVFLIAARMWQKQLDSGAASGALQAIH